MDKDIKKKLFKKPDWRGWVDMFIIIMVIFMAFAYKSDIDRLNEHYEKIIDKCECNNVNVTNTPWPKINLTLINESDRTKNESNSNNLSLFT